MVKNIILGIVSMLLYTNNQQDFVISTKGYYFATYSLNLGENDFFEETSPEELLEYFAKKIPANKYTNAYGEEVSVEVVAVIDYFNLFENVEFDNFTEIYCRHFIEKKSMVVADVIEKYYPDFSITK